MWYRSKNTNDYAKTHFISQRYRKEDAMHSDTYSSVKVPLPPLSLASEATADADEAKFSACLGFFIFSYQ